MSRAFWGFWGLVNIQMCKNFKLMWKQKLQNFDFQNL
jgi:hypothetical protein